MVCQYCKAKKTKKTSYPSTFWSFYGDEYNSQFKALARVCVSCIGYFPQNYGIC